MTIEVRHNQKHLVCTWVEPSQAVFQGKTVTINRKLMRRLKLSRNGEVSSAELTKLGSRDRTKAVRAELARMRRSGLFSA